VDRYHVAYR